jgi:putative phage-type endonuclease
MTTFGVTCCNCSTKTAVTSEDPPNFCAICGSKEIVLQGEVPVDRQDEQPVRAQLTKPLNPFRDGVAILEGSSPSVGGFCSVLTGERVSSSDSENNSSLDKKLADRELEYERTKGKVSMEKEFETEVLNAPAQGTEDWLNWRKQGITATEAGLIMHPSKYGSGLTVYTDKLGLTTHDQSDPDGFMEWGHRIEDLLVSKFMEQHPDFKDCTQGRLYQRDWAKCSLDAQAYTADGTPVIIECKTGQNESKWSPIPEKYYAQVQWQMYVTGIRKAYFSVLICGHQWFEREVEYSETYVEELKRKCFYIWDCIQNKTRPNIFGSSDADKSAIAALAGESGHEGEPLEVTQEEVETYIALKKQYEEAEEAFTNFKNKFGFKMIDHQRITCDGKTFASWVERKGAQSIDKVRLMNKYPDVYKDCVKQGPPTRYVRYSV